MASSGCRLHGLIQRLPRSNPHQLTSEGIRVAVFYTTLQNRHSRYAILTTSTAPSPKHVPHAYGPTKLVTISQLPDTWRTVAFSDRLR